MEPKRCSRCGLPKPHSQFHRDARQADGYTIQCKECRNAKYRESHPSTPPADPPWSEAEDARLREIYPRLGAVGCAPLFGRSLQGIYIRANRLGLHRDDRWTEGEISLLLSVYRDKTNRELAEMFGRSASAVGYRLWQSGVRHVHKLRPTAVEDHWKPDQIAELEKWVRKGLTYAQMAPLFGRSARAIRNAVERYALRVPPDRRAPVLARRRAVEGDHTHRHDAHKRGATSERVDRDVIYERDSGRCYLCRQPVSRASAVLEHVIPLSRGGPHNYANVRLACRSCNTRKADKLLSELDWYEPHGA